MFGMGGSSRSTTVQGGEVKWPTSGKKKSRPLGSQMLQDLGLAFKNATSGRKGNSG